MSEENIDDILDQLDEVSKQRLAKYTAKAAQDNAARGIELGKARAKSDGSGKSYQNQSNIISKMHKRQNGINTAARKLATEEVDDVSDILDQLDEVSKGRLAAYIGAASADKSHLAHSIGMINGKTHTKHGTTAQDREDRDELNRKHSKRSGGIQRAANKLAKEETELKYETFIESVVEKKPVDAKAFIESILAQKVEENLDAYAAIVAEGFLGEEAFEITEENIEEVLESLSDEDLAALSEELDALAEEGLTEAELHEVSKERLSRYLTQAPGSKKIAGAASDKARAQQAWSKNPGDARKREVDANRKHDNRGRGIELAKKKIKEEVEGDEESLQELSRRGILSRYIRRTNDDPKRAKGNELALKKKWGDKNHGLPEPKVKGTDESVEDVSDILDQLDEVSQTRLRNYLNKAKDSLAGAAVDTHKAYSGNHIDDEKGNKAAKKYGKRWVGMNTAIHKATGGNVKIPGGKK